MNVKPLNFVAVAIFVGSGIAHAADAPVTGTNWSGFYLGLHGGYGTGEYDWTMKDNPGQGASPSIGEVVAEPGVDGWIGGVQAGINAQNGNLVLGFEGELSAGNIEGDVERTAGGDKPGPREWSSEMNWMLTFGPRVGYAFDSTLLYVEGGFAMVNQDFYHLGAYQGPPQNPPPASPPPGQEFDGDETQHGVFLGAGLEQSFTDNLSGRIEYNYVTLSEDAELLGDQPNPAIFDIDQSIHVIKVGLNYRFPM
jgi:outer membrane immunogenic protein